jgi:hypothetical protein
MCFTKPIIAVIVGERYGKTVKVMCFSKLTGTSVKGRYKGLSWY